jgi:hypothetical protein
VRDEVQSHLDFFVEDLAAAETTVLATGANQIRPSAERRSCLVFADPARHPFCLSTWDLLGN